MLRTANRGYSIKITSLSASGGPSPLIVEMSNHIRGQYVAALHGRFGLVLTACSRIGEGEVCEEGLVLEIGTKVAFERVSIGGRHGQGRLAKSNNSSGVGSGFLVVCVRYCV